MTLMYKRILNKSTPTRYERVLWVSALSLLGFSLPYGAQSQKAEFQDLRADSVTYERNPGGDDKVYADGSVEISQGDGVLKANSMVGFFKKNQKGATGQSLEEGTTLSNIEAIGQVVYLSETERAYGQKAYYDVVKEVLVLKGTPACVSLKEITLTGQAIQFDQKTGRLEALGNVTLKEPGQRLKADELVAYFKEKKDSSSAGGTASDGGSHWELVSASAQGHVQFEAPSYRGKSSKASFEGDEVILSGNVRISEGQNFITGDEGRYNRQTQKGGVGLDHSSKDQRLGKKSRARALFYGKSKGKDNG